MVSSSSYLRFKIDAQGLHPLPDKVEVILNAPASVTELKLFLGLLNYYGKLILNLSTVLYPIYANQPDGTGIILGNKRFYKQSNY